MQKIEHRTLTELAYDEITQGMVSGRFLPGQVLIIRALADSYGISATPIREALQRLVAEHRLDVLPNRSIAVPKISKDKYLELLRIRCALEGLAAELATPNIDAASLEELGRMLDELEESVRENSSEGYVALNQKFHFHIYEKANSPHLLKMIQDLWSRVGPLFNELFADPDFVNHANDEHRRIYAALERGDPAEVYDCLVRDIHVSASSLHARG